MSGERTMRGRGEINVADHHLATEISMRVLPLQREAERVAEAVDASVMRTGLN
jgi:hypothetical protein